MLQELSPKLRQICGKVASSVVLARRQCPRDAVPAALIVCSLLAETASGSNPRL